MDIQEGKLIGKRSVVTIIVTDNLTINVNSRLLASDWSEGMEGAVGVVSLGE